MPGHKTFESFYFRKVGLGEGCGCAERIIDTHEIERRARPLRLPPVRARLSWRRFAAKWGLVTRPALPPAER